MKRFLRLFMPFHIWLYQLTKGKLGGSVGGYKVLLLTTRGRKSGKLYTTPLGRFDYEDGYLIAATYAGQPKNPAWYFNLKSNPQVTVQVPDKTIPATAEVLSGEARAQAWRHIIAIAPTYANYETRATREIPVIFLHPISNTNTKDLSH